MRTENFSWSASHSLRTKGVDLDLHNCFDFRRMTYDVEARVIELEWIRGTGSWVSDTMPRKVTLKMKGISEMRFTRRDSATPYSDDDCLASFGYHCDEDWVDGQFWQDQEPDPGWRWSFLFQSGAELLVTGEIASVETEV